MIALSIALGVVGLAALWTARDVALRLHRGSEAAEALRVAREALANVSERCDAADARVTEALAVLERVSGEHASIKARLAFAPERRRA